MTTPRARLNTVARSLIVACGGAAVACAALLLAPSDQRVLYTWSAALSNVDQHPQAPLFSPGPGYGSPLVEVTFPDAPRALPYRFLVDTGSPATTITSEVALEMDLRPLHSVGVKLDGVTHPWARVGRISMGDIELRQVPVVVVDTIAPVGSTESQVVVDGILGMNVLSAFAWEMSPSAGTITAHPPGHPLPGSLVQLGSQSDRLVIAGGVGLDTEPGQEASENPGYAGEDTDLSWAPILIPSGGHREPPKAALAPPPDLRDRHLPPGGPHLLQLCTGLASTYVHPELLPWAGGIGELATEALPLQVSLIDHLTAEILDERAPADILREVTRYQLPSLNLGPVTLHDLDLYHRDAPWPHTPLAGLVGADVLGSVNIGVDVSNQRLTLTPTSPSTRAPSIQAHLMIWAESMLNSRNSDYFAQEEAMRRFLLAGRWPEASQLASRLIQDNPRAVAAWMVLARQSERRGDLETGLQFYRRLFWVKQGQLPAILGAARLGFIAGDFEAALADLAVPEAQALGDQARIRRAQAHLHLALGDVEAARAAFRGALDGTVDDAGARRGLAWLAWQEGRLEEAEAHLDSALNLTPSDTWAQDLMVAVLRRQGRAAQLDPFVESLARHFPYPSPDGRDPIAPLRIRLAREGGDTDRAMEILRLQDRAQQDAADASPAPKVRANALEMRAHLYLAARHDLSHALTFASEANAADPARRAGLLVGAQILRVLEDSSQAAAFNRAWQASPFDLAAFLAAEGQHVPELAPIAPPPQAKPTPMRHRRRIQYRLPDRQ